MQANKRVSRWQLDGRLSRGTHAYPGANGDTGRVPQAAEEQEATPEHAEAGAPEPPDAVIPAAPVVQAGHQIVEGAGRAHVSGSSPAGGTQAVRPSGARSPRLQRTAERVVRGGHRGVLVSGPVCDTQLDRCQVFFSFFSSLCAHGCSGNDRDRCQVETSASWAPWWVRWRARLPWSCAFPGVTDQERRPSPRRTAVRAIHRAGPQVGSRSSQLSPIPATPLLEKTEKK